MNMGAVMKAICVIAFVVFALPAAAQEARPLPPDSFQYDGMPRIYAPPSPVTVPQKEDGAKLEYLPVSPLPRGAAPEDSNPVVPKPKPKVEKVAA